MFLYGWGWFIYLYMNSIYYCYLQCAVHKSIFLSSTRDLMGQQKGCWAIKNNLNHHQPSRRHFVSEFWGLGRAALRWRRPYWRSGLIILTFLLHTPAPAHTFSEANLPLPPPQNTPASQQKWGRIPKGSDSPVSSRQTIQCMRDELVGWECAIHSPLYQNTIKWADNYTAKRTCNYVSEDWNFSWWEIIDDCGWSCGHIVFGSPSDFDQLISATYK